MSENLIVKEFQKQAIDSALVHLYELEVTPGNYFYFTNEVNNTTSLTMRDYTTPATVRTYIACPVEAKGFEATQDGAIPRPTVQIANIQGALKNAIGDFNYQEILGLKCIRRTTLRKHLYDVDTSNPPVEFARQVYYVDRIKTRTKMAVEIELVSPFDLENVRIPARVVHADRCSFQYQGGSTHLAIHKRAQSGCRWHIESRTSDETDNSIAFVNMDEEYIVPANTGFTAWGGGASTADAYYKTTETMTRNNANGTVSSVTVNNYWQAVNTENNPGTPSDSNASWNRIRVFSDYNQGTEYFTYADDRHNSYVRFTDNVASSATNGYTQLWKAKLPSLNEVPYSTNNSFWEKGDQCAKTTKSCKMRFAAAKLSGNQWTQKAKQSNTVEYPFGGFPAARKFN